MKPAVIIGKPSARRATILGRPLIEAADQRPAVLEQPGAVDGFQAMVDLTDLCHRTEGEIEAFGDRVASDPSSATNEARTGIFTNFAGEAQGVLNRMADGPDRNSAGNFARKEGFRLMDRAGKLEDEARAHYVTSQLDRFQRSFSDAAAADPAKAENGVRLFTHLVSASGLPQAEAQRVLDQGVTRIRQVASEPAPQSNISGNGNEPAARTPTPSELMDATQDALPAPPSSDVEGQQQGDQPSGRDEEDTIPQVPVLNALSTRNSVLEAEGFRFVDTPHEGVWLGPDGERADPRHLRSLIVDRLERRAEAENWSPSRILSELYAAKAGLPRADEDNVDIAFAFAPFIPFIAEAGAVAASAAGTVFKAVLGGTGLAVLFGLSGDTPLEDVEVVETDGRDQTTDDPENDLKPQGAIPVPLAADEDDDDDRKLVIVYRVEGEGNQRILIGPGGEVTIIKDRRMLHLNFGQRQRAQEFLEERLKQGHVDEMVRMFKVPKSFLEELRAASIKQFGARKADRLRVTPRRVDEKKALDQFELPKVWIERLRGAIELQSGREETADQFQSGKPGQAR